MTYAAHCAGEPIIHGSLKGRKGPSPFEASPSQAAPMEFIAEIGVADLSALARGGVLSSWLRSGVF
jgi:hypothetical protein